MPRHAMKHVSRIGYSIALLFVLSTPSLAAKGGNGNGGGKPGGGEDPPPPATPVSYSVTPIEIPGTGESLFGFSENGSMVGNVTTAAGRRALAYLPGFSSNSFYLDDPEYNLQGIPPGWHTRNAVDINGAGLIVGNIASDAAPDDDYRSFVISGASTGVPTLHELPLLDSTSQKEAAVGINDSGDIVVWSQGSVDGATVTRAYVGNVDSDGNVTQPFITVDPATQGFPFSSIAPDSLQLSNRDQNGSAVLVGEFYHQGQNYTFRVLTDGTGSEVGPNYVTEDGANLRWNDIYGNWGTLDVNSTGDATGGAVADPAKNGKIKRNFYAGLWEYGSDEIAPVGGFDEFQSEWWTAALNDDGDFLLQVGQGPGDALWLGDWSSTNGALDIASLIDPTDPNRHLYSHTFDLTNRNSDGWPTIFAVGYEPLADDASQPYWLILTAQGQSAGLATAAVPEPSSVVVALLASALIASASWKV